MLLLKHFLKRLYSKINIIDSFNKKVRIPLILKISNNSLFKKYRNYNVNYLKNKFIENKIKDKLKKHFKKIIKIYVLVSIPTFLLFVYLFHYEILIPKKVAYFMERNEWNEFFDLEFFKEVAKSEDAQLNYILLCFRLSSSIRIPLTIVIFLLSL